MYINSSDLRSFYSTYSNPELDSKSIDYLVVKYQKYSKLLDKFDKFILEYPDKSQRHTLLGKKLSSLKSSYYSAICNKCIGVILNLGRNLHHGSITESDLLSYGEEVLLKCLTKWDSSKNIKFITYFTSSSNNMLYTLKNKKHFRDWNYHMSSLDALTSIEDLHFDLPEESALKWGCVSKKVRVDKNALNEELNKIIFNPGMVESIKEHLGMSDDLVIHYMLLSAKKRRSIINSNELEVLSYLKNKLTEEKREEFSIIYMYESDDEYKLNKENQNNNKEEILCQE